MAEGFEIKVPITLKGGREGEKVGKQIGEKIAAQIKKAFSAINIGGGKGEGAGISGMLGVTKGLKGVSTKLGVVALAITAAVGLLAKASPYLKGILSIFGRAFMIFFRPFGDFLATLLRPLALLLMKMAVAFMRWTRSPTGEEGFGTIEAGIEASGGFIGGIGAPLGLGMGLDKLLEPLLEQLKKFPGWLWEKLIGIWTWTYVFSAWIWDQITGIWEWTYDFAGWIWEQITSIWTWTKDFGSWLWDQITSIFGGRKGPGEPVMSAGAGGAISDYIPSGNIQDYLATGGPGGGPVPAGGIPLVLNQTMNFSGNIEKDVDIDEIVKRAGRQAEMDLKQRGVI